MWTPEYYTYIELLSIGKKKERKEEKNTWRKERKRKEKRRMKARKNKGQRRSNREA